MEHQHHHLLVEIAALMARLIGGAIVIVNLARLCWALRRDFGLLWQDKYGDLDMWNPYMYSSITSQCVYTGSSNTSRYLLHDTTLISGCTKVIEELKGQNELEMVRQPWIATSTKLSPNAPH